MHFFWDAEETEDEVLGLTTTRGLNPSWFEKIWSINVYYITCTVP
jgi:hypothetical protein